MWVRTLGVVPASKKQFQDLSLIFENWNVHGELLVSATLDELSELGIPRLAGKQIKKQFLALKEK